MATGPLGAKQFYGGLDYLVPQTTSSAWISSTSRWWIEYRQQEALFGEPDRLVIMVCSKGGRAPTNATMEAVLQVAEAEAPGAEIVVMGQPGYVEGHLCGLMAATLAQQEAVFVAQQAVVSHAVALGATRGPVLPLLRPEHHPGRVSRPTRPEWPSRGQAIIDWTGA